MADKAQLAILRQGAEAWNAWRLTHHHNEAVDLREADLREADLIDFDLRKVTLTEANLGRADLTLARAHGADLTGANLLQAKLRGADLRRAILEKAYLMGAELRAAGLWGANLRGANLSYVDLHAADLSHADLRGTNLSHADLTETYLQSTVIGYTDLSTCEGLDRCQHQGPCIIDFETLQRSGPLPLPFLRGIGLPDNLIDYLPSLMNQSFQLYSCFISYSAKDDNFVQRLHADLQNKGVRCWFAPHDMPIGAKILDAIDEAIRLRDKVLLVLSEASIASDWVEGEVTRALEEERQRKQTVLLPIRIDNAVMETTEAWARLLRGQRNIGDFTRWKGHDTYSQALNRLLNDLRTEKV